MSLKSKLITPLYLTYLHLLSHTCKVVFINEDNVDLNDSVLGFWHGESFATYLMLRTMNQYKLGIVLTSDPRGEYIADLCAHFSMIPLRLPNGAAARHGIADIIKLGKTDQKIILAFSIDGPLGPFHVPKKMVYHIAQKTNKKVLCLHIEVSKKIVLKNRWDQYAIPLPFSRVTMKLRSLPPTTKEELQEFDKYQQKITYLMNKK